jgi:hypothetical protein
MTTDILEPRIELMSEEYVLVQAWKKTAHYIRNHNWFSDTLELDRTAVNLPLFLAELAEQLKAPNQWSSDPLRIVPAPKSQPWRVTRDNQLWEPVEKGKTAAKLRPLAHVSLKDQVAATAVMLCLADRVETLQGDPRDSIATAQARKRLVSYGNRLFCDATGGALRHRWGSQKLYRAYFQDYRSFLARPEIAAEAVSTSDSSRVVIVHSDLRQFYDRVRPQLLAQKVAAVRRPDDDPEFYALTGRLFDWSWAKKDSREVTVYAEQSDLTDFSRIALPQGLVAAGFFANVALLDFDQGLRDVSSQEIGPGIRVEDASRYVDDLRIVLTVDRGRKLSEIESLITKWLQEVLDRHAKGLTPAEDKTRATTFRGDERPMVRQSRKMERIQGAISGGFDAIGGEEILNAVQGLIRSQERYSEERTEDQGWPLSPIPDVRDPTVARFAAGRFRSTYRSLRPLLEHRDDYAPSAGEEDAVEEDDADEQTAEKSRARRSRLARTQTRLDDEARAFALGLIENWVEDPSNVRLLRIGLDLWPADDVLENVLKLLRPFTEKGGRRKAPRRVAWYCLSEIFRAGATETGFVVDDESFPLGIDIDAYRSVLRAEAIRLASLPRGRLPWYLRQQILLFLAASDPTQATLNSAGLSVETRHYAELIRFLKGESEGKLGLDFATLAVLARRSFLGRTPAIELAISGITPRRLEQIAERDPSLALEILVTRPELSRSVYPRLRDDLCLHLGAQSDEWMSLAEVVLDNAPHGPLRNELEILRFAIKFLTALTDIPDSEVITPSQVRLRLANSNGDISEEYAVKIVPSRVAPEGSMYRPPPWCPNGERWRFQLGYLLRFILTARPDFTKSVRLPSWRERAPTYRAAGSHWYQRLYGLFNAHAAFGDDWLPISDWTERLLSALLAWPGSRTFEMVDWVQNGIESTRSNIQNHLNDTFNKTVPSSGVLMLPLIASWPVRPTPTRPLRACVVQTVIPKPKDFTPADLTLSDTAIRKRHRNHLSAALAAIERMLDLRETHEEREGRLDWLILPELAVHPRDVRTHLVPFARAHKSIILAGLTYQELFEGQPLVNSALWVIPQWSKSHGLQILIRRQGKLHLAPEEEKLNAAAAVLQGFRPCQWLVGYKWSSRDMDPPLRLTASICYDATDLSLAADLRARSDVFAIPSLNKDVSTFDQMALALHYHMFQLVIVANNGIYGGSNAYAPFREAHVRQVFHLHGQPQASVAFLEIDDIAAFLRRKADAQTQATTSTGPSFWKLPPAGI